MGANELLQAMRLAASQQTQDWNSPFVFGHVASYACDANGQRVRLILPSVRDAGDNPVLTGWLPFAGFGGNGWGFQFAPKGGATFKQPTAGELCLVMRVDRDRGGGVAACMISNQVNAPPFLDLAPGECGLKNDAGSFVRLWTDGHIEVNSKDKVVVTAAKEIDVNPGGGQPCRVTGNMVVTGALQLGGVLQSVDGTTYAGDIKTGGNVVAGAGTADQVGALTHTHVAPAGGGTTSSPNAGT